MEHSFSKFYIEVGSVIYLKLYLLFIVKQIIFLIQATFSICFPLTTNGFLKQEHPISAILPKMAMS